MVELKLTFNQACVVAEVLSRAHELSREEHDALKRALTRIEAAIDAALDDCGGGG